MIKPIINNPRTPPPIPKIKVEGSDGVDGDGPGGDGPDATHSTPPLNSSQIFLGNTLPWSSEIKHEVCEPSVLLVIHP